MSSKDETPEYIAWKKDNAKKKRIDAKKRKAESKKKKEAEDRKQKREKELEDIRQRRLAIDCLNKKINECVEVYIRDPLLNEDIGDVIIGECTTAEGSTFLLKKKAYEKGCIKLVSYTINLTVTHDEYGENNVYLCYASPVLNS